MSSIGGMFWVLPVGQATCPKIFVLLVVVEVDVNRVLYCVAVHISSTEGGSCIYSYTQLFARRRHSTALASLYQKVVDVLISGQCGLCSLQTVTLVEESRVEKTRYMLEPISPPHVIGENGFGS